jgi:hypothetical protein
MYFALSVLISSDFVYPGATRFASLSACPWLSYRAPLALQAYRAPLVPQAYRAPLALQAYRAPLALQAYRAPLALQV